MTRTPILIALLALTACGGSDCDAGVGQAISGLR